MTKIGHNSGTGAGDVAKDQLLSIIERWERLEEEKKGIVDDQKEIMAEAKGNGLNPKVLRRIIKTRAADSADLEEFDAMCELYASALGMPNVFA